MSFMSLIKSSDYNSTQKTLDLIDNKLTKYTLLLSPVSIPNLIQKLE